MTSKFVLAHTFQHDHDTLLYTFGQECMHMFVLCVCEVALVIATVPIELAPLEMHLAIIICHDNGTREISDSDG